MDLSSLRGGCHCGWGSPAIHYVTCGCLVIWRLAGVFLYARQYLYYITVARIIIAMGDGMVSLVDVGVSLAKLHVAVLYLEMTASCWQFFLSG